MIQKNFGKVYWPMTIYKNFSKVHWLMTIYNNFGKVYWPMMIHKNFGKVYWLFRCSVPWALNVFLCQWQNGAIITTPSFPEESILVNRLHLPTVSTAGKKQPVALLSTIPIPFVAPSFTLSCTGEPHTASMPRAPNLHWGQRSQGMTD